MLLDLVKKNRSTRRFDESFAIDYDTVYSWLEVLPFVASQRNMQMLKYIIVADADICNEITAISKWAGYIDGWDRPPKGERPRAYLIQLLDTTLLDNAAFDEGMQLQSIRLMAIEQAISSCVIMAFDSKALRQILNIDERYKINAIVAFGKSAETCIIEDIKDNNVRYYRDENGIHHIPKRQLSELIINSKEK